MTWDWSNVWQTMGVTAAVCIPLSIAYVVGYKRGLDRGAEIGKDVWRGSGVDDGLDPCRCKNCGKSFRGNALTTVQGWPYCSTACGRSLLQKLQS